MHLDISYNHFIHTLFYYRINSEQYSDHHTLHSLSSILPHSDIISLKISA